MTIDDQILKLYETGAPVEVIATAMEMPLANVQASLFAKSAGFRATLNNPAGAKDPRAVSDEMLEILIDVARSSNNQNLRVSTAKFVRDDLLGRRDAVAPDAGLNTTALISIGEAMNSLHEKRLKFLSRAKNAIIDA